MKKCAFYAQKRAYCAQEIHLICPRNAAIMLMKWAYYAQEMCLLCLIWDRTHGLPFQAHTV